MNHAQRVMDCADQLGPEETHRAFVCAEATASFPRFIRESWPVFHESAEEQLQWEWYLDCIGEHLEAVFWGEITWLFINIMAGCAKSLITSVMFPAWGWLHRPYWRYLCSAVNDDLTGRDAARMKKLVSSEWYQDTFLPDWQLDRGHDADRNFMNSRGGGRLSRTVASSVTGQRPHCRIVDDANDPEKVTTEEFVRVNHWIDHTLMKRKVSTTSPLISIQHRVHEDDFTGHCIAKQHAPKTVHLFIPNRFEPKLIFDTFVVNRQTGQPWTDPRTVEDELLNPRVQSQADTDQEREDDPGMDSAQNQQNPTPEGGIIFTKEMFRRWSHDPEPEIANDWEAEEPTFPTFPLPGPDEWDYKFITADFNNLKKKKATKGTDYAVIDVWGVVDGCLYLIQEFRQKIGVSESIRVLMDLLALHEDHVARVLIESKANGPSVIAGLRAVMDIAHEAELPRSHQFIRDWNVQGETKIQRAEASVHVAKAGKLYIQCEHENGEVIYWLFEVCGFPNRTNDDRVDTLTMALTYLDRHPDGR